ncbi:unnamed protein product [Lampetra fluviatilis]
MDPLRDGKSTLELSFRLDPLLYPPLDGNRSRSERERARDVREAALKLGFWRRLHAATPGHPPPTPRCTLGYVYPWA